MLKVREFIQSFLVILGFTIFGLGAIVLNFLVFPLAKKTKKGEELLYFYSDVIHRAWGWFINILKFIKVLKLNVSDIEELKNIKNKIIVSTHPSFIDVLILMSIIPRTTCIVKASLAENVILKNLINSIFILEDETLENLKIQTKKMLDSGFNVIIFPSGIRHRKNEYPKIRKGAATIAINANVDIVAVKLYTDFDFLFINKPIYEVGEKPVTYELSFAGDISVKTELAVAESEIKRKLSVTKKIEKSLYE